MFDKTVTYLRCLTFQIGELIRFSHRLNKDKGTAGKKWSYELIRRHPRSSPRQPQARPWLGHKVSIVRGRKNSSICLKELLKVTTVMLPESIQRR